MDLASQAYEAVGCFAYGKQRYSQFHGLLRSSNQKQNLKIVLSHIFCENVYRISNGKDNHFRVLKNWSTF